MRTDSCTETELVARAADDLDAFGELVERYRKSIQRQCYSRVGDWQYAEDLAQETFVRAYLKLGQLADAELFPNWLRRIASNVCNEFMRSPARRESAVDILSETEGADEPPPVPATPLDTLPQETRACIELFYNSGLSYSEIAASLHASIASVKGRLSRAKAVLRKELAELEPKTRSAFTQRVLDTLEQLRREDPEIRRQAAMKLRSALSEDRIEHVLSQFTNPIPMERSCAIGASRKHRSPRVRDALVDVLLHDGWDRNRLGAANLLVAQRDPSVIPYLEQAMADTRNPRYVVAAAKSAIKQLQVLGPSSDAEQESLRFRRELGEAAADPKRRCDLLRRLTTALRDTEPGVRDQAPKALQELDDRRAVPAVAKLLDDPVPGLREAAAIALGQLGGKRAVEALASTFEPSYGRKRPTVVFQSLIRLGDRAVLPQILNALDAATVWSGMLFAERVAVPDDLPMARRALKQFSECGCPAPWRRTMALLAAEHRSTELIHDMAEHRVCLGIAICLARIGDVNARQAARELLLTRGSPQAAEGLAECGDFGIRALREALRYPDANVRLAATSGLSIGSDYTLPASPLSPLAHPKAVQALRAELGELEKNDPSGSLRLRAKMALKHIVQLR